MSEQRIEFGSFIFARTDEGYCRLSIREDLDPKRMCVWSWPASRFRGFTDAVQGSRAATRV